MPLPARVLLSTILALFLTIADRHSASAQTVNLEAFPFGEIQLPEPQEYCVYSLKRQGSLSETTRIVYTLVPEKSEHIGQAADFFVGFRRSSQPEQLWLLHTPRSADEVEALEYTPGTSPTPYHSYQSPFTLGRLNSLTIFSSALPANLTELATRGNEGEILIGYGLHTDTASTTMDSFQEMLDNSRFVVVWRAGSNDGISQICFEYSKIRIVPNTDAYPGSR
jgi:hypothetical protein